MAYDYDWSSAVAVSYKISTNPGLGSHHGAPAPARTDRHYNKPSLQGGRGSSVITT